MAVDEVSQQGAEAAAAGRTTGAGSQAGESPPATAGGGRADERGEEGEGDVDMDAAPVPPRPHEAQRPPRPPLSRPLDISHEDSELLAMPGGRVACPWCPGQAFRPNGGFCMHLTSQHPHTRINEEMIKVLVGLGKARCNKEACGGVRPIGSTIVGGAGRGREYEDSA